MHKKKKRGEKEREKKKHNRARQMKNSFHIEWVNRERKKNNDLHCYHSGKPMKKQRLLSLLIAPNYNLSRRDCDQTV